MKTLLCAKAVKKVNILNGFYKQRTFLCGKRILQNPYLSPINHKEYIMPLPSVARFGALQCKATRKTLPRQRCYNPSAYGCTTCRFHGARRKESIKRGKEHPNYKHGGETLEARALHRAKVGELQQLESLGREIGLISSGSKTRGPKVKLVGV